MKHSGLKLSALKGGAFRHGSFFYIVPLDPAVKGGIAGYSPVKNL
jgi:hypothetical protein